MFYLAICLLIFVVQPIKSMDMMAKTSDKYGIFNLKSIDVEMCRGPKLVDLSEAICKISKNADDIFIGNFSISISDSFKFDEVKIMVYNFKKDKKNLMWNYKLTDPCKHFAVGSLLALHLKAEKCVVKQGIYNFEINFTEMVHKFFGSSFFYGDYFFKVMGLAKKGNIACMIFHQVFEKKSGN